MTTFTQQVAADAIPPSQVTADEISFGLVFGNWNASEAARLIVLFLHMQDSWEIIFTPTDISEKVLHPAGMPAEFALTDSLIADGYIERYGEAYKVTPKFIMACQAREMVLEYKQLTPCSPEMTKVELASSLPPMLWSMFGCCPYFEIKCSGPCGGINMIYPFHPSRDCHANGTCRCMQAAKA